MYVIFKVPPFHKNIARAIQKAPKFYFYDTGQLIGDSGIKSEKTFPNSAEIRTPHKWLADIFLP